MAGLNFDPFGGPDPFASIGRIPGLDDGVRARPQRPEYRRPLPPEAARSLGEQVLNTGASGLGWVTGTLDKPGQAVRGVLAGKGPAALKHLIPFSDSLGITGEADKTSGRDLTDAYGVTEKGDQGWGSWGLGLAADIATDPLTYTTFGAKHALTPAGQALSKAGQLKGWSREALLQGFHGLEPELRAAGSAASDVTHMLDQGRRIASPEAVTAAAKAGGVSAGQPLSGLARIGIPFTDVGATIGTGARSQAVARGIDKAADWAKFGNPVGRTLGQLFDPTRHEAVDAITQRGAQRYYDPAFQALKQQGRGEAWDVLSQLDPLINAGSHSEQEITSAARAVAEGLPHMAPAGLAPHVAPVAGRIRQIEDAHLAAEQAAGAPTKDVADAYAKYVHRQALDVNHADLQLGRKGSIWPTASGSNISREDVFRDIPGGTTRINNWWTRFAGNADQPLVARAIKKDMVGDVMAGRGKMTPQLGKTFDAKAEALAERLAASNPKYAEASLPLFTPNLAADVVQRGTQHARQMAAARAVTGTLGDIARRIDPSAPAGLIPIPQVLRSLGLQTMRANKTTGTPIQGALVEAYRSLAKQGAGKVDPFLQGKLRPLRQAAAQYGVTPEHFAELMKAHQKWAEPEVLKAPLGAIHSATNTFKALAYPIWIPSHVRNAATALVNNLRSGTGLGDYAAQKAIMQGNVTPEVLARYGFGSLDEARKSLFSSANIFGAHGLSDDIASSATDALLNTASSSGPGRFTPIVPGSDRAGTGNLLNDATNLVFKQGLADSLTATGKALGGSVAGLMDKGRSWGQSLGENLGIKGVGGAKADVLPAVKAGRIAGNNIEDFFRGSQWLAELRQGATPEQAAAAVNKLHFDYDAATQFEKNRARVAFPFYTFARKNLPLQVETALTRPGILQAQTKPFNQDSGEKGYVPKYLQSGVAIPTGPETEGKRQYISKLGLPAEEAFERLHFKNGLPDVPNTVLDYMGQLNPLIKAPLEQIFDTQFHTQRKLSDLRATGTAKAIGQAFGDENPQLLGQVMSNTPFTRFFTAADKLADERKSLPAKLANLLTGVRVTDVDTEKSRAVELRQTLEDILRQHPNLSRHTNFYVKPEDAAKLSPEEIELMRLYSGIQDAAKQYGKEKRQRIGIKP